MSIEDILKKNGLGTSSNNKTKSISSSQNDVLAKNGFPPSESTLRGTTPLAYTNEKGMFNPTALVTDLNKIYNNVRKENNTVNTMQSTPANPLKVLNVATPTTGAGDTTVLPQSAINEYALRDVVKQEETANKRLDSGAFMANYTAGDIQTELNRAYSDYSKYPTESNKLKVDRLEALNKNYTENAENVGKGGIIRKDFASYLPQQVDQLKAGAEGAIVGALPGLVTFNPALAAGGAKAGYVANVTQESYKQMQGGAYRDLLAMNVPPEIALKVSQDSALWQSLIEGAGAVGDIATLGIGKLLTQPAKTATQATAKELLKEALKAYGFNLVSEAVEEGAQEYVGIKGEKVAMAQAGLERETTPQEDWRRIGEAAKGGAILGGIMGAGNFMGNISTTLANNQKISQMQKNNAPESAQNQETRATNEVILQEGVNQDTANVVQNNANTQNVAQNEVENLEKTTYNEVGGVEDGRTKYKLSELVERESQNIESTEKILKAQPKISEKNLTKEQKKTKDLAKQKYNKNIIYYDGKNVTAKGLTTKNNNIYIDKQAAEDYGSDFVLEHEMAEDMIFNHTDKTGAEFDKLIEEIQKSKSFTQMYKEYSESLTSQQKQDLVFKLDKVAKEILCDVNGGRNTTQSQDVTQRLKSQLGDELYNKIVSTLDKYEKQIYKSSEQQGSFLMPTAEELNKPSQEVIEGAQALNLEEKQKKENTGFMLVNPEDSYKRNIITNNAKAMNDLIKAKRIVSDDFDAQIKKKQDLLNSKKDKTTKVAQTLQNQIINLQNRKANAEEKFIKQIDRLKNKNEKMKKQVAEDRLPTRKEIKQDIITQTDMENINLDNAKDLSKFIMNNTTPLRVNEKVFDRETAAKINDTFFKPIKTNEAERIRFLNKERSEIESLGIAPNSKESEYVQIYGEGEWVNPTTGEASEYTLEDLKKQFPDDWEKIKNAAEKIREKYDTYLDAVNKELNKMGYDSIPKLKNYFRHFEATTSLLDQIGIPSKADHLPTDMNGLTSDLRPGKNFFANALSRTGKKTTYDAITGIDGYLEGVSKLMYHTEDIQKLRTFDEYIRNKYGQATDLEGLSKKEFQKRVEQIQEGHLSEYAAWLSEYTNNLAGKKSKMDRGTEEALGRRIYGTLNAVKKQVGSNLTGLNLNSALSNFISIIQAGSKTSKYAMLEGLGDTVKNIFQDDGFINKSDFLTRRFGSDKLFKTAWEKASNAGQVFMAGTDYFSANLITRSKYYEYLNKGYPDAEAMKLADEFADRIMGGRALGDMPNIFNSKTLGILTQFQLENVNQFDAMFHDTKYENRAAEQTKYDAKTWNEKLKSKLANEKPEFYNSLTATLILGQLFAYAWAYNKIDEELTGSGGAFDPIGIIEDLIKDFTNPNLTKGEAIKNLALNIVDVIPYANIITGGGRVPMTDALPNIVNILEGEAGWDEALKALNLVLPTGGGQLLKTAKGAIALAQGGDYKTNAKGEKQLKFPIAQEGSTAQRLGEAAQALLFGKWATPGGQKYIEDGFKPLSAVETEGLERAQEMGIGITEFYDIMEAIEEIEVPKRKNAKGKEEAIPGARKQLVKEELENRKELTTEQKKLLYDIFYSKEL